MIPIVQPEEALAALMLGADSDIPKKQLAEQKKTNETLEKIERKHAGGGLVLATP